MPRHSRRPPRRPRWGLVAAIAPVAVIAVLLAAWGIDTAVGGAVVRNVEVAGRSVGGDERDELDTAIEQYAAELATTEVRIHTPVAVYDTTVAELGVAVDAGATREAVLDAGHGFVLTRPFRWAASFLAPHEVDPVFTVDRPTLGAAVDALQGDDRLLPAEPAFQQVENGALDVIAGVDGSGIDPADVAAALPEAILDSAADGDTGAGVDVRVEPEPIPPLTTDEAMRAVVDQLNNATVVPLTVVVAGSTADIDPVAVRSWLRPVGADTGQPAFVVDQEAALATLREALPEVGSGSRDASFDLIDGQVVLLPSQDGTGCCADDSATLIEQSLQQGVHTVSLTLGTDPPELSTETAQSWAITQPIGGNRAWPESRSEGAAPGFTTFHAAGQSRVVNIHRMADLVRGALIPPGGTFSINSHVGRRTAENGFVAAGAIRNGEHVDEIGGGVSQFATTLFNAAYFAGLDLPTYQAHSEYFSRYPRGREATMGYPNPDLVLHNTTPYGVMIWTSYTDASLTITLYSTPYATGEQTDIREGRSGNCAVVTTTRTRTYVDGRAPVTDEFRATYRPGAGRFC